MLRQLALPGTTKQVSDLTQNLDRASSGISQSYLMRAARVSIKLSATNASQAGLMSSASR